MGDCGAPVSTQCVDAEPRGCCCGCCCPAGRGTAAARTRTARACAWTCALVCALLLLAIGATAARAAPCSRPPGTGSVPGCDVELGKKPHEDHDKLVGKCIETISSVCKQNHTTDITKVGSVYINIRRDGEEYDCWRQLSSSELKGYHIVDGYNKASVDDMALPAKGEFICKENKIVSEFQFHKQTYKTHQRVCLQQSDAPPNVHCLSNWDLVEITPLIQVCGYVSCDAFKINS